MLQTKQALALDWQRTFAHSLPLAILPPLLQEKYKEGILFMPMIHKKAIISCYLASHLVYKRGLDWSPNIADVLPMIAKDLKNI